MSCGISTSLTRRQSRGAAAAIFAAAAAPSVEVGAADLDVDGRGQAEVEHGIDQAADLEIGGEFRHLALHAAPHAVHVLVAADLVVCR